MLRRGNRMGILEQLSKKRWKKYERTIVYAIVERIGEDELARIVKWYPHKEGFGIPEHLNVGDYALWLRQLGLSTASKIQETEARTIVTRLCITIGLIIKKNK